WRGRRRPDRQRRPGRSRRRTRRQRRVQRRDTWAAERAARPVHGIGLRLGWRRPGRNDSRRSVARPAAADLGATPRLAGHEPRRRDMDSSIEATPADPGLEALVILLQLQGVAADRQQIRHRLGTDKIGAPEILRSAKDLGLKARARRTTWSRLARTPLPAIATLADGGVLVLAKASEHKGLIQSPRTARPQL